MRTGALLEVEVFKKCALLWCKAHFEVKVLKTEGLRACLNVEMSKKCTPLSRQAHLEANMLTDTMFASLSCPELNR